MEPMLSAKNLVKRFGGLTMITPLITRESSLPRRLRGTDRDVHSIGKLR